MSTVLHAPNHVHPPPHRARLQHHSATSAHHRRRVPASLRSSRRAHLHHPSTTTTSTTTPTTSTTSTTPPKSPNPSSNIAHTRVLPKPYVFTATRVFSAPYATIPQNHLNSSASLQLPHVSPSDNKKQSAINTTAAVKTPTATTTAAATTASAIDTETKTKTKIKAKTKPKSKTKTKTVNEEQVSSSIATADEDDAHVEVPSASVPQLQFSLESQGVEVEKNQLSLSSSPCDSPKQPQSTGTLRVQSDLPMTAQPTRPLPHPDPHPQTQAQARSTNLRSVPLAAAGVLRRNRSPPAVALASSPARRRHGLHRSAASSPSGSRGLQSPSPPSPSPLPHASPTSTPTPTNTTTTTNAHTYSDVNGGSPNNAVGADAKETSTPRKPRTWATTFKRHATSLAAQISQLRQPSPRPPITTQAEFRRTFLKSARDRILHDLDGNCFRLIPIMMNGDCGFASIAKGINTARESISNSNNNNNNNNNIPFILSRKRLFWLRQSQTSSPTKRLLQPKDIRVAMYGEIRKAKKTYLADLNRFGSVFSDADVDRLEREVSRPGIAGHWLGTVLGLLEHVIIAHALNVNIYLYQFDLQKQGVRQFEDATVENADCDVFLFFTGPPASGHFDALIKVADAPPKSQDSPPPPSSSTNHE